MSVLQIYAFLFDVSDETPWNVLIVQRVFCVLPYL